MPRSELARMIRFVETTARKYHLKVGTFGHMGDGNLHPTFLTDERNKEEMHRVEEAFKEIFDEAIRLGGTITGEHGVGVEKINQMCVQFGTAELELFQALKRAFDPHGLLNPGKAVPTLHRCAEYGAMRVKGGALPHPGLPRF